MYHLIPPMTGNVTDEIINAYIDNHSDANRSDNVNNISLECYRLPGQDFEPTIF